MSEYSRLSEAVHQADQRNAELTDQLKKRTDELLAAFWKDYPKLEMVDRLELNLDSLSEWVKNHAKQ